MAEFHLAYPTTTPTSVESSDRSSTRDTLWQLQSVDEAEESLDPLRGARFSLIAALILTLTVVTGWIFGVAVMRSFLPGRIDMKLLTCVVALVGAITLWFLMRRNRNRAISASAIVLVISILSLTEYVSGERIHFFDLLSPDVLRIETINPGRLAPTTATAFVFLAAAWIAMTMSRSSSLLTALLVIPGAVSCLVLTGYLYGAGELRGISGYSPMALPTAMVIFSLTFSTICLGIHYGILETLGSASLAGMLLRRLLPAAVLVPLFIGWLRVEGESTGLYGMRFGVAIFAVSLMIVFVILVAVTARLLRREEEKSTSADRSMRMIARVQQEVVTAERDVQSVMELIALRSQQVTLADASVIEIADGESMVYRAVTGTALPFLGMRVELASSLSGQCHRSGKPLYSGDTQLDVRVDREACRRVGARSMLIVPLANGPGGRGVLKVYSSRPNAFSEEHQKLLLMMAGLLGAVITHSQEFATKIAAIAEQAAEIEELRARLESFVELSPAMAWIKDSHGHYVYSNAAFQRAIGDSNGESLGSDGALFFSEETMSEMRQTDLDIISSGNESTSISQLEIAGVSRWWMTFRFPLSEQRLVGAIAIDVTEQQVAREEIRTLNLALEGRVERRTEELKRANEQLESFSYSVSHDLRAPLRAIDGYSRMLEEDYGESLDDEGRRMVTTIRESTSRMGTLIAELLEFSRVSGEVLRKRETDVSALVREVAKRLVLANPDRIVSIDVGDAPPAFADRALLEQVVVNLLSNAVKYSGKRDRSEIRFRGWLEDSSIFYSVEDNGAGFDMRFASKLFGVFQRLHRVDEFQGTGVGLAIVKRIVERHGGKVWASSAVNKGSTFTFTLPAGAEEQIN